MTLQRVNCSIVYHVGAIILVEGLIGCSASGAVNRGRFEKYEKQPAWLLNGPGPPSAVKRPWRFPL